MINVAYVIILFFSQLLVSMDQDPTICCINWKDNVGRFEDDAIIYYCSKTPLFSYFDRYFNCVKNEGIYSINRFIYDKKTTQYRYESVLESKSVTISSYTSEKCAKEYNLLKSHYDYMRIKQEKILKRKTCCQP